MRRSDFGWFIVGAIMGVFGLVSYIVWGWSRSEGDDVAGPSTNNYQE